MELQGHFTAAGLDLLAQLTVESLPLVITRVVASSERTEDISTAVQVSPVCQTLKLKNLKRSGQTLTIPAVLQAQDAEEDYILQELGVYAQGLNETEVLYQIYQLSEPITVQAANSMVLHFYLQNTVADSGDMIVVADSGVYLTQSDLDELEERILPKAAETRELSLDIAKLQAYLDAMPRLLNEHLTIHVSGTLSGSIRIQDFYGSGSLVITGDSAGNCTISLPGSGDAVEAISVRNCGISVELRYLTINIVTSSVDSIGIYAERSKRVYAACCTVKGTSTAKGYGMYVKYTLCSADSCTMSSCNTAVRCAVGIVSVDGGTYNSFSLGAVAYYGGIITITNNTNSQTLGGASNAKQGGLVVYSGSVI